MLSFTKREHMTALIQFKQQWHIEEISLFTYKDKRSGVNWCWQNLDLTDWKHWPLYGHILCRVSLLTWQKRSRVIDFSKPGFQIRKKSKGSSGTLLLKHWESSYMYISRIQKFHNIFFLNFLVFIILYNLELVTKCKQFHQLMLTSYINYGTVFHTRLR